MPGGRRKRSAKRTSPRTVASPKRSPGSRVRRPKAKPPLVRALVELASVAKRLKLRWYVFGAQAVNLMGFPRATADLDVTVDLDGKDPVLLVLALRKSGFEPRFADARFIAASRVIPVVHRKTGLPIDIVLAGPGLEQMFLDEVVQAKIGARRIPILSLENLIVTKLIAGRPKDLEDVRELIARSAATLDGKKIEGVLAVVEDALGVSDLIALFRRLR